MKSRSILRHFLQRGYLNPDREIRKGHRYASALSQPYFIRQQRHLRPGHAGFGGARLSAGGVSCISRDTSFSCLGQVFRRGPFLIKIRLRTKFLLSLLAITAGLTAATLLIVSYNVRRRVRENIRADVRNSVANYQTFQAQQEEALTRSAALLANLPNVRALMTTEDAATIEDASADVWKLSGSDLLVLANRTGRVVALRASAPGLDSPTAQGLLRQSLDRSESTDWWFGGGHLYEVRIQPIYFGSPSQNMTVGLLALGHEVNQRAARDFAGVASSEVAFNFESKPVASTLTPALQSDLARRMREPAQNPSAGEQEIQLGSEALPGRDRESFRAARPARFLDRSEIL